MMRCLLFLPRRAALLLVLPVILPLCFACAFTQAPAQRNCFGADYALSPYQHINNRGVTSDAVMPYNIAAISGATLAAEGPGVVSSVPLSVRESKNRSEGLFRGLCEAASGAFVNGGLDLGALDALTAAS